MKSSTDINKNLAGDYLSGAENFICAADTICSSIDKKSTRSPFSLEDPTIFLLGHASELMLKAGLAKHGALHGKIRSSHDLLSLLEESQKKGIVLDSNFCRQVEIIGDDFNNHSHRYSRTFAGFPDDQHDRLTKRIYENTPEARKELKEYGLMAKSIPNIGDLLSSCQNQYKITADWILS